MGFDFVLHIACSASRILPYERGCATSGQYMYIEFQDTFDFWGVKSFEVMRRDPRGVVDRGHLLLVTPMHLLDVRSGGRLCKTRTLESLRAPIATLESSRASGVAVAWALARHGATGGLVV